MADAINKQFYIEPDTPLCQGHFPDNPILPAAAQAQWVLDLAAEHRPEIMHWEIRQLKLMRELTPGRQVEIALSPTKQGWRGVVSDADGPYAQMTLIAHD